LKFHILSLRCWRAFWYINPAMDEATLDFPIPDDPAEIRRLIVGLNLQRNSALRAAEQVKQQLELERQQFEFQRQQAQKRQQEWELEKLRLEFELARANRRLYGPRGDQVDTGQLLLEFATALENRPLDADALADAAAAESTGQQTAATDTTADATKGEESKPSRRLRRGRRNLAAFDKLPVTQKIHDLPESDKPCPCCGQMRCRIGQEQTWQIEYIPGRFERIEHVQIRYACKTCEQSAENPQIALAEKPPSPIDKGMAGPGLLACVVTAKYADYLPLYRLENIFARAGFEVARSTQCLWCGDVANIVKPVYDLMCQRVRQSHVIGTDDTVLPLLQPALSSSNGPGEATKARMWAYLGDDDNPYNVFDFTTRRNRDGPALWLKDFTGVVLADAYGGYDGICIENESTKAGCWAHSRRKFVDAEHFAPDIARQALALIGQLYEAERAAKELSAADRLTLRQTRSLPVLGELHQRLTTWSAGLLPKHPMRQAIGYLLNQWQTLCVFAHDGAVAIDNNLAEQEMKRIALMRKNSLFVASQRGGQTAAILASLTSTCRRHEIDPQLYFTQLLCNLATTPTSQLATWLPDQWKLRQANEAADTASSPAHSIQPK
jgi:transposase